MHAQFERHVLHIFSISVFKTHFIAYSYTQSLKRKKAPVQSYDYGEVRLFHEELADSASITAQANVCVCVQVCVCMYVSTMTATFTNDGCL